MRMLILSLAGACLLSTPLAADPMRHGGNMFEGMSIEGRKRMAAEMIDGREKMKASHETRKSARDKVRAAMIAEPYNPAVLRSAFEDERKLAGDQQKMHHEHMVDVMGKLSPSDRKAFAEKMRNMEQRMGKMHGQRKGDAHPDGHQDGPPPPLR